MWGPREGPQSQPAPSSMCLSVLCHFLPVSWPYSFIILKTLPQLHALWTSSILSFLVTCALEVSVSATPHGQLPRVLPCPRFRPRGCRHRAPHLTQCCFSHQSSDILSSTGYETIIQHLNNGRKNCKEFEDFLKERYMLFLSEDRGWTKHSHTDKDSLLVLFVFNGPQNPLL